jgi:hypothetical protein
LLEDLRVIDGGFASDRAAGHGRVVPLPVASRSLVGMMTAMDASTAETVTLYREWAWVEAHGSI